MPKVDGVQGTAAGARVREHLQDHRSLQLRECQLSNVFLFFFFCEMWVTW